MKTIFINVGLTVQPVAALVENDRHQASASKRFASSGTRHRVIAKDHSLATIRCPIS
jgi:hypothetical protein